MFAESLIYKHKHVITCHEIYANERIIALYFIFLYVLYFFKYLSIAD